MTYLSGRYDLFMQIPFRRFALTLTDGSKIELTINPHLSQARSESLKTLRLSLLKDGKQKEAHEVSSSETTLSRAEALARQFPWISRVGEDEWFDERDGDLMTSERFVDLYADETHPGGARNPRIHLEPGWLQALHGSVAAHLIEAQRLLRLSIPRSSGYPARPHNVHRVLEYTSDLRTRINDTMARYGQQSQRLDQSFPKRLLTSPPLALSAEDLKTRMGGWMPSGQS